MKSGIYIYYFNDCLTDSYIGSTNNLDRRNKQHLLDLSKNIHSSFKFQLAYNKYKDNIKYEILEEMKFPLSYSRFLVKQHLECRELYWQEKINPRYIVQKGGSGHSIDKMREVAGTRRKKVYELDEDDKIINEYESITEAARQTGFSYNAIMCSINVKTDSCNGHRYRSQETITKRKERAYPVIQVDCYSKAGLNFIGTYKSITEAGSKLKLDESNIARCVRGNRRYYKEYIFVKHGETPVLRKRKSRCTDLL